MRILIVLLIMLAASGIHAQDRIVTLSYFSTPTIVEIAVSGTSLGTAQAVNPLPRHLINNSRPDLVALAGSRYMAWTAQVAQDLDCRELIAVYDRRTRNALSIPGVEFPCTTVRLISDPRRPRLFVHRWAATFVPGQIGIVDELFQYHPLVVADWIGTALAYAPEPDQIVVTRVGTPSDPSLKIVVLQASTGAEVNSFAVSNATNDIRNQLEVTKDGRRVFLYYDHAIRSFDVATGTQTAVSPPIDLGDFWWNRFVLDEALGIVLVPHRNGEPTYVQQLLAFDASTLGLIGEGNPGGYGTFDSFQPLKGRAAAAAYVLTSNRDAASDLCRLWIDALDGTGVVRGRADVTQLTALARTPVYGCPSAATMLSPPSAPVGLTAVVQGHNVTLNWINPANVSQLEFEVGLAAGRRDLIVPVGVAEQVSFDGVPAGIYYVRLRAINELGPSPLSNEIVVAVP